MDFSLSEEQQAIFDMAKSFGETNFAPYALDWDEKGLFPRETIKKTAELGMGGIYVCEDVGGSDLSRLDATLIFEALAHGCPSIGSFISIHNMCAWMIDHFGNDEQRKKWLPSMTSMENICSYCLTEPGSGSDAAALTTSAKRQGNGWNINGSKAFISGGDTSELYLTMVRTSGEGPKGISAILIENPSDGLSFGANERKMGWRAQPTSLIQFDDCLVPDDHLIGVEGKGFTYAMAGLDGGRLNIAASALGGAQAALDKTLLYMQERSAFGKSISQMQALQFRVADMETELQAARVFLRQAAWKLDNKTTDASKHCAMAKRFVTDVAFKVANDALQLHGGYGYLSDFGIEKIVRDLRVHQILEGTNEIMRVIIARSILDE